MSETRGDFTNPDALAQEMLTEAEKRAKKAGKKFMPVKAVDLDAQLRNLGAIGPKTETVVAKKPVKPEPKPRVRPRKSSPLQEKTRLSSDQEKLVRDLTELATWEPDKK